MRPIVTITCAEPLSAAELEMLLLLAKQKEYSGDLMVVRRSAIQFDLGMCGTRVTGVEYTKSRMGYYTLSNFSAWLPLACLQMWRDDPRVGPKFFDELQLADWSFVRDLDPETQWHNFEFIRSRVPA